MEFMDAVRSRRSIRRYKHDPVPEETIRSILEVATYAPSAKRGEQWRFNVLTGDAKKRFTRFFRGELDRLIAAHGQKEVGSAPWSCAIMENAPVNLIVWNTGEHGWVTEEHSVAAAIEHALLRATDLGVGSLWIGDVLLCYEGIRGYFGKNWKLSGAIVLGYSDEEPLPIKRRRVDEVAEFQR